MHGVPSFPPASAFFPTQRTLPAMRDAVQACRACDLFARATQGDAAFATLVADLRAARAQSRE